MGKAAEGAAGVGAYRPPVAPSGGGSSRESGISSQFIHPTQPRRANCLHQQRSELVMNCEIAPVILVRLGAGLA
jgi:hypothetical protein